MRGDRTPHSQFTWLPEWRSSTGLACTEALRPAATLACSRRRNTPYILLRHDRAIAAPARQPANSLLNAMLNEVYNSRILDLAGNIPRLGRLDNPDATATAHSKLCGSTVTIDLKMDGDTVTDFSHVVKACALGQASSSIMARNVIGAKADELRSLRETVRRMLKENGTPPSGRWADIAVLEPVRDYKARHASTMLTFDAVTSAIDQIEAKRRAAMAAE
jgi:NifU-like protein involved in Fe-S cluster formation